MDIFLNGRIFVMSDNASVADLIAETNMLTGQGFAVAVNDCVIPRSVWSERLLCEGDRVTLIHATAGG